MLNSFLNVAYVGGCFSGLKSRSPLVMGILMGATLFLAFLDITTAVYWGQLSYCKKLPSEAIEQYSCQNTMSYSTLSCFASVMCIIKVLFLCALLFWRKDLVDDTTVTYDAVPQLHARSDVAEADGSLDSDFSHCSRTLPCDVGIDDAKENSFSL